MIVEDLGECIQAFVIAMQSSWVSMRSRGVEFHRGRHRWERTVVCAPYLIGRREMMTDTILSGRLLVKSRPVGVTCGTRSPRLRLLAAPFFTSGVSLSAALSDRNVSTGNIWLKQGNRKVYW